MFILKNVNIPFNNSWKRQDVLIDDGIFIEISDSISSINTDDKDVEIITPDYKSYLIPAMVDPHVHVREPGFDYKEDWATCSKAALKGGVSAIIDMPNNKIPIDDLDKLEKKEGIAHRKSYVNYGLYIALTNNNANDIARGIFSDYICGIKIYMAKTTGGLVVDSPSTIRKALLQPKPVLAHTGGRDGLLKLIKVAEDVLREQEKVPTIYICHVSTAEEVDILRQYKKIFSNMVAEVTPHHLFLNRDEYHGPPGVLPGLGNKEDQQALWNGLADGTIDIIGTDHAPHTLNEKVSDNPPSGFPGLETALPLLFDSLIDDKLSIDLLIKITSKRAVDVFKINGHGKIEINQPANCTLIIKKEWKVGEDGYQTKCNWSPFDGKRLKNRVYLTIVNGNVSYMDGKFNRGNIKKLCTNQK